MATIRTIAHPNELTKDVKNDNYLLPRVLGTLNDDDIIRRLEAKEIATKNVNGKSFVRLFLQECILAVTEGYNVVTIMFQATLSIKGTVYNEDLGRTIPADRVNVSMRLNQGVEARAALSESTVHIAEQTAPRGPVIQSVTNPVEGKSDVINTGAMVLIRGIRLTVAGEPGDEVGIFFTSTGGGPAVVVPAEQLSPNTQGKLQFVLPAAVTAGEWSVAVASRYTNSSGKLTNDIRKYDYPGIITVE